jgi:hypothetical protein
MNALEFKTLAKDGIIKIPNEYKISSNREVKVIVLYEEPQEKNKNIDFIDNLLKNPVKIANFKPLSREEIYG